MKLFSVENRQNYPKSGIILPVFCCVMVVKYENGAFSRGVTFGIVFAIEYCIIKVKEDFNEI